MLINSPTDNLEFVLGLQKKVGNPVLFCFVLFLSPLMSQPVFQHHLLNNPSILPIDVKQHHHYYTGINEFSLLFYYFVYLSLHGYKFFTTLLHLLVLLHLYYSITSLWSLPSHSLTVKRAANICWVLYAKLTE